MTYNVEHNNSDLGATVAAIANVDADLALLQEVTPRWEDALVTALHDTYPHRRFQLHRRPAAGLAVLSKAPIEMCETFESPVGWFPAARIVVGGIQILHVHLRPAIDQGSWIRGYTTTPPLRAAEVKAYWAKLDLDLPTVIAGDFNEATFSGEVIAFLKDRQFVRVPAIGPRTWHYQDVISFDLDHIMTRGLIATDGVVLDVGTSDHRPVLATIAATSARSR